MKIIKEIIIFLQIWLILAKIIGYIDWSWWLICLPMILTVAFYLFIISLMVCFLFGFARTMRDVVLDL